MASGLEVIGGISAVVGLFNAAIDIGNRIIDACDKKSLVAILKTNNKELTSLNEILEEVKTQEVLQTKGITFEILNMEDLGTELKQCLESMDPTGKGSVKQFGNKFLYGEKDRQTLNGIIGRLTQAKLSLTLRIQTANVGLTKLNGEWIVANTEQVLSLDNKLRQLIEDFDGLQIVEVVKNHDIGPDGNTPLSDEDLKEIGAKDDTPSAQTSRVVEDNLTFDQALMLNSNIGEHGWREVAHLVIQRNIARGNSTMVNAAISEDQFDKILAQRIAVVRAVAGHGGEDSHQGSKRGIHKTEETS